MIIDYIKNFIKMISSCSLNINSKFIIFMQLGLSLFFAVILLFPNFSAQWNPGDDHEIIDFMGKDHSLSFKEIPSMLIKTEVGFHSEFARYRPVNYFLKLIEIATWGNHPFPWYAFRIALFGISIFIAWLLMGRLLGVIAGGLVCLLFLSHSFWQILLMALGPAEHYCMIGLALYCFAFVKLWEQQTTPADNKWWFILAFGAILCMGSKENFLFLLPVTAILVYHSWKYDQLNKVSIFTNSIIFIFGLFVTIAVIVLLKRNNGVDIYNNSVDPMSRFKILLSGLYSLSHWKIQLPLFLSLLLLLSAILVHKFYGNKISRITLTQLKRLFFVELVCVFVWYSQFFFYNGRWPNGSHYDFPGVLAQDLAYVFLFFSPLFILKNLSFDLDVRRVLKVAHSVLIISLSIFIMRYGINNFKSIYDKSIAHRNETQQYANVIAEVMTGAKKNPIAPIILVCTSVYNYEQLLLMGKILVSYNIHNPIVLVLKGLSELTCRNAVELNLLKILRDLSKGKELNSYTSLKPRFYPVQALSQLGRPCVSILLTWNME